MVFYVNNIQKDDDDQLKFYCPVKGENFLFILKFKMKICESRVVQPSNQPTVIASRVANALTTLSMSDSYPQSSSNVIPAIRHSLEADPILSHQHPARLPLYLHSNSSPTMSPNLLASDNFCDRPLQNNLQHKRKKNEFQLSQERDLKKSKSSSFIDLESESPLLVRLEKKPISGLNSWNSINSKVVSSQENHVQITTYKESNYMRGSTKEVKKETSFREPLQQSRGNARTHQHQNQQQEKHIEKKINGKIKQEGFVHKS